jgi:hypothetical protein
MADFGFVYLLTNPYMDGVYKIGCTERSPHARADELSKPTGVPAPFRVFCYIECANFQSVERRFHEWLKEHRISDSREFFHGGMSFAVRIMYWHPNRLTFCAPDRHDEWGSLNDMMRYDDFFGGPVSSLEETANPFEPKKVDASAEDDSDEEAEPDADMQDGLDEIDQAAAAITKAREA